MNNLDFSIADGSVESAAGSLSHYRGWRRGNTQAEFNSFLDTHYGDQAQLDDELLIELATTDLIHMISHGHHVRAELYIACSKSLAAKKEQVLDLIDAEICARSDQGETINAQELADRFPELKSDLKRLLEVHEIDMEASHELRLQREEAKNFGDYQTKLKIADSDSGYEVWSAIHRELNKPFSMICWEIENEHTKTDIQRKLQQRQSCQHPSLINIVEVGFAQSIYYVVNPIDGETLVDWLDNPMREVIQEETAANWTLNILEARQTLVGTLNRQFALSLDHVFITTDKHPLLIDSPALFDAYQDEPSFESVIQSIGLLLFAICLQETDIRKIKAHLDDGFDPIMLNDINENISADFNSIYLSCVHPKPKKRYRQVDEIINDLKNFLSDKPLKATKLQRKWFK